LDSIGTKSAGAGADIGADIGSGTSALGTDAGYWFFSCCTWYL